jgi:alpha-tubulin suppressor-like RCC1 family protein
MFRSLPRLVSTGVPALAVAGAAAACHHGKAAAAEPQRESYSWGSTTFGETGHGHELIGGVGLPAPIDALRASGKRVRTLVSSGTSCMSAALTEEGDVFSWGCGQNGRLGHGDSNANQPAPRHIEGLPDNVAQVAVGEFHGLALTATGHVYSWGTRGIGHDNKPKGKPALVPGFAGVRIVHITAGREHSVAVDDRGAAYAWGAGSSYALGHGDKAEQKRPLQIMPLAGACLHPAPRASPEGSRAAGCRETWRTASHAVWIASCLPDLCSACVL